VGDRVSVDLTVLTSQANAARNIFPDYWENNTSGEQLTTFTFSEVNYGNLDFLPQLVAAGIAYESNWGCGSEFNDGTEYLRFNDKGEDIEITLYERSENPDMSLLMKHIDDPVKLRQLVINHLEATTVLPWDNQEDYGKVYRTVQLIAPT